MSDKTVREPKGAEAKRTKKEGAGGDGARTGSRRGGQKSADIGRALRSVYDETLREDVPDDFKDLLGKLS